MHKIHNIRKPVGYFFFNYLVLVAIILLVLITMLVEPNFVSYGNMTNIMRQFGPLSLVALGMTFVIIGGFIDLSVAGIFSLVAVVTLSLIEPLGQWPALLIGLLLGAFCGFINSALIITAGALSQAEALFITFGMSLVFGALALMRTGGAVLNMRDVERDKSVFEAVGQGTVGIFTVSFLLFLGLLTVLYFFQSKTIMGRAVCLTGGNKTAAGLAGLPVKKTIVIIYTLSGLMAALGAITQFSRVTTAAPVMGKGFETNAILAVVVGGTSLRGGKGSVLRTVLGTLLIILMSNCLNLLGVTPFMQNVTKGVILILAIWLDNRRGI